MLPTARAPSGATATALHDPVSRPSHYCAPNGLEARHVIADWDLAFNLGNAVKYILRAGKKGPAREDLAKARQYLHFVSLDLADGRTLVEWRSHRLMRIAAEEVAIAFDLNEELTIAIGAIRSLAKSPTMQHVWLEVARREVGKAITAHDLAQAARVLEAAGAVA